MERFDIEQPGWRRSAQSEAPKVTGSNWHEGGRFISLRKYSTAICLIEALTIAILVYLLVRLPPSQLQSDLASRGLEPHGNVSNLNLPYRTYYSNKLGLSLTVLPGLVPDCTQRRHDLSKADQCQSSRTDQCRAPMSVAVNQIAPHDSIQILTTSESGLRMDYRQMIVPKQVTCKPTHSSQTTPGEQDDAVRCRTGTRIEIDHQTRHQKIIGWGGALSDSSVNTILGLTVNGTNSLLDDYFGEDGLRFNMVRVTIGGSDFSARFYTNADLDGSADKPEPARLNTEDYLYKIPMMRFVRDKYASLGEIKFFASMWSPPTWMKTNNHFNKGRLKGAISDGPVSDIGRNGPEKYYDALSQLKMDWLLEYAKSGISFWGLTVMNEPVFAVQPFIDFNTMIFEREDYANYVAKYLGPKLRENAATSRIKLMVHDDNRRFLMNFTKPILDQKRVRQFVDGVSVHGYVDQEYSQMDYVYENYRNGDLPAPNNLPHDPNRWFVLPTELCSGHLPFMEKALVGNWHRGMHYALDIIKSLQHSAAGWVDWNMVLDTEGGPGWLGGRLDAPVIVDKGRDVYYKSPMFYVLGQFSYLIRPGSQRLHAKLINGEYDNQLEVVTFALPEKTRNSFVTVVVNNNPYPIEFLLNKARAEVASGSKQYYLLETPADSVMTIEHN